jgi:hypothetical protein
MVRDRRYRAVTKCAAQLMRDSDLVVYSPITHSHHLSDYISARPHHFWMRQCMPFLAHAAELLVLRLDGWDKSRGVDEEVLIAAKLGIPINFIDEITQ